MRKHNWVFPLCQCNGAPVTFSFNSYSFTEALKGHSEQKESITFLFSSFALLHSFLWRFWMTTIICTGNITDKKNNNYRFCSLVWFSLMLISYLKKTNFWIILTRCTHRPLKHSFCPHHRFGRQDRHKSPKRSSRFQKSAWDAVNSTLW